MRTSLALAAIVFWSDYLGFRAQRRFPDPDSAAAFAKNIARPRVITVYADLMDLAHADDDWKQRKKPDKCLPSNEEEHAPASENEGRRFV